MKMNYAVLFNWKIQRFEVYKTKDLEKLKESQGT
jgi:hypothetical protein